MGEPERGLELLARAGYAVRGVVYLIVAWFALRAATAGSRVTDGQGALRAIQDWPFGDALLIAAAAGLAGYAVWRVGQGVFDPDREGRGAKAVARRIGYAAAGLIHLGLAAAALRLALHRPAGAGGDAATRDWTAILMAQPWGRWLVAALALGILAAAAGQAVKAWKASFLEQLPADPQVRRVMRPVGRAGFGAKSVVFALVGLFFLTAAWQADPQQAGGLGQALQELQRQPAGPWLLGAVAVGLAGFGLYSLAMALYRRIRVPALPS